VHLKFLELPTDERRLYIEQAAARRNVPPVMLEKDFWVCWILAVLFESKFGDVIVFKGGTSLSKVFAVIDRFSEDIDLSLSPVFLGLTDAAPPSRTKADLWMKKAEAACAAAVKDQLRPELERTAAEVLGDRSEGWFEFAIDEATNSPVLLFHYPTTQPTGFDYLKRSVKLEFGSLTDQQPTERHPVRPWIAEVLDDAFDDWRCNVVALDVHRTFWEKATILHSEHHRPADKPTPDRFSRHYADTVALAQDRVASTAVGQGDLRDRVVAWKSRFFGSAWARYDLARPDTFRLAPPKEREAALRQDYAAMREMYLSEPRTFDDILRALADLERRINSEATDGTETP
jgi:hypothetical protein